MTNYDNAVEQDQLAALLNQVGAQFQQFTLITQQIAHDQQQQNQFNQQLAGDVIFLRNQVNLQGQQMPPPPPPPPQYPPPQYSPPPIHHPDLKLSLPPPFLGNPSVKYSFSRMSIR